MLENKKQTSLQIYNFLSSKYKKEWWPNEPYKIMIESVLVQNTTWKSVEKAEQNFKDSFTPEWIEMVDEELFSQYIYSCRYGKVKTKTIKSLTAWFKKYNYDAEKVKEKETNEIRKELLAIKGIGPETADDILVYSFYKPSFIIDVYTRRLLIKLGFNFKNDTEIRKFLTATIPETAEVYDYYHGFILQYSKDLETKKEDIKDLLEWLKK